MIVCFSEPLFLYSYFKRWRLGNEIGQSSITERLVVWLLIRVSWRERSLVLGEQQASSHSSVFAKRRLLSCERSEHSYFLSSSAKTIVSCSERDLFANTVSTTLRVPRAILSVSANVASCFFSRLDGEDGIVHSIHPNFQQSMRKSLADPPSPLPPLFPFGNRTRTTSRQ